MTIAEKLVSIAERLKFVYDAGRENEYNRFWDAFQQNGTRKDYMRSFNGNAWTAETFTPKYDLKPAWGGGSSMFQSMGFTGSLKAHLNKLGIKLDLSNLLNCTQLFYMATGITEFPDLDLRNCINGCTFMFYGCAALTSVKIIISENVSIDTNSFTDCSELKEIRFEGTLGKSLDLHWSKKLSAESLQNILDCLSTTSTGQTLTLPTTAEATYDAKHGGGAWAERVNGLTNWEIKYA